MWKLFAFIGSSWDDILEYIRDLHQTGVSWGAIITSLLLWNKIRNNKRLKELDERMESKLNAIMRHRGVPWDWDAEKRGLQSSTTPLLYKWLHKVLYLAQGVVLYIRRMVIGRLNWRGRSMIDKRWLISLLVTLAGLFKAKMGIEIPIDLINTIVDWLWLGGVIGIAVWNMYKSKKTEVPYVGTEYSPGANK